jgi:hypothetical protein
LEIRNLEWVVIRLRSLTDFLHYVPLYQSSGL